MSKEPVESKREFDITGDPEKAADKIQPVMNAVAGLQKAHPEMHIAEFGHASAAHVLNDKINQDFANARSLSLPLTLLTAWHMLVGRARVEPGEDVLIHAAGSGVGSVGIQVAKLRGARVIATAGSEEKREKARQLGADDVVDYTREDSPGVVSAMT